MAPSAAFRQFQLAQQQVNRFLWSSELSYELIRQRLISTLEGDTRGVHDIFANVKCHAFVPPSRVEREHRAGRQPRHTAKYQASLSGFERDLLSNLEPVCAYVIVRFYSALERFIWTRVSPLLGAASLTGRDRTRLKKWVQAREFQQWEHELAAKQLLRQSIERTVALTAQAHRMLRNELVHKEHGWRVPWNDEQLRAAIRSTFSRGDARAIEHRLCRRVERQIEKRPGTPPLFFYALFGLTDLRTFAAAYDASVVESPAPSEKSAS